MIGRRLFAAVLSLVALAVQASTEGGPKLMNANTDLGDRASLQNGARLFVNYCVSCHSASFMRYNRIAADLGIPEDKLKANMMFTTDKIGDTLTVAMRPADAEKWFGIQPPDLSVIARSRGEDWLYSYLQGFYADPSRPTGMNNLYLPGVSMPHVLWELQGIQRAVHHKSKDAHGNEVDTIELTPDIPGKLSDVQYRREIRDLVNFLVYVGEPAKLVRYQLGFRVLLFLTVLLVVVYLMKREYWKDVY